MARWGAVFLGAEEAMIRRQVAKESVAASFLRPVPRWRRRFSARESAFS
jgi:hypothetical protein